MPLPIVAVVGRPNVGKSTFVNRIAQADEAIVHEMRGVTRDRSYHEADWNGVDFKLIDTGGIEMGDDDAFQGSIRNQALAGANEADVILFLVDGKTGVNADDEAVARILRKTSKPVFLVVNKLDTPNRMDEVWEFYQLGLGDPWPVSAMHGHGTGDLLDEVVNELKKVDLPADADEEDGINVAIIGRPNAGKSSLTNKLTANDRSIVSDVAGTTRDAIDTHIVHDGQRYTIVDTAGLRRKSQIDEDVEYYGFVRAMRAIDRANVALLVIDSTLGLTDQDQRVAGFAAERGCAMVIVLNKWDLIEGPEAKAEIRERIADRLTFVGYAPVIAISALTGKKVDRIWDAVNAAYENYSQTIPTNRLNTWLAGIREFGHTVSKGKAVLRMKYVTQTATCPPQFTFFANRPDLVDDNFERYLENRSARELRARGYAHQDQVQEEGLKDHGGFAGCGRPVRRRVSVGIHSLRADHLEGVLPYRPARARQRQYRHHQRHPHDGQGRRLRRVRSGLRQGPAVGRIWPGRSASRSCQRRLRARRARHVRHHAGRGVPRLRVGPYLLSVAWLQGRQGDRGGRGLPVRDVRLDRRLPRAAHLHRARRATTKRVSVGSIAAAAACPFFALYFFWGDWLAWLFCTVAGLTVVWAHRENIKRLRAGTESRIGDKGKKKEA